MLSAGRPVFGSVIATRLRQVSAAHVRTVALSRERTAFALLGRKVVDADAVAEGASAKAATEAAPPTSRERRPRGRGGGRRRRRRGPRPRRAGSGGWECARSSGFGRSDLAGLAWG